MDFEIIDFHTHPFLLPNEYLAPFKVAHPFESADIIADMDRAGVSRFCGSVIAGRSPELSLLKQSNESAIKLAEKFDGRYIPGVHVHPAYIDESVAELEAAFANGVRLIGELVPYFYSWSYTDKGLYEILSSIKRSDIVVSLHTMDHGQMEELAATFPNLSFVFAHPGDNSGVEKHVAIMKRRDNVYVDVSGSGLVRYGMVRCLCDAVGAERILFGSDYPICNLHMYVAGIMGERLSDAERELIFAGNTKRLLGL